MPWFSMDHIAGHTLEQAVREHPTDAIQAARCVQSVATALQHAHDHGVLHPDLEPSNILLDTDEAPRITGFGIARVGSDERASRHRTNRQSQFMAQRPLFAGSPVDLRLG